MNIAVIPARGGSKRLPGKNIRKLAGKPLIAWTIEAAISSQQFQHVYVSTDCKKIAKISKEYGAEIPFIRPPELSTDIATTNDVIIHLIDWYENRYDQQVKTVTILQPTSPLRTSAHIKEAKSLMLSKSARAIISVCELEHPLEFCNTLDQDNSMNGFIDPINLKRTQDIQKVYRLNGAIYIIDRSYVEMLSDIYSDGSYAYIMNRASSIDIDNKEDFDLADFYMQKFLYRNNIN